MAKTAKARRIENSAFIKIICIVTAVILASGTATIGMMNLLCTNELYTEYTTALSAASALCGLAVFAATAAVLLTMSFTLKYKAAAIAVTALALAVRLAASLLWHIEPESDFLITYELGKLLAHTPLPLWGSALDSYGTTYNSIWAVHMPFVVYQSLLLKITENAVILRVANAFFSFGTCLLISKTAKQLGGAKAYRISLTFTALDPALIFLVPVLTNQHIAQFFFVLGVFLFFRLQNANIYLRSALAGLCLGISQLMRPEMWVIVLAAGIYVMHSSFKTKQFAKRLTAYAAGLCVFLSVLAAMNTFLTSADVIHRSIYRGNLNYKIMVGLNPETNGSWSAADSQLEGNDRAINTVIRSRLKTDPIKLLPRLYGKSVYQLGTYVYTWSYKSDHTWISQMIMRRGGAALMLIVCAIAVWRLLKRRKEELIWIYISLLGYAAVYALIEVQGRYSMTFIPLLITIAAVCEPRPVK